MAESDRLRLSGAIVAPSLDLCCIGRVVSKKGVGADGKPYDNVGSSRATVRALTRRDAACEEPHNATFS